jgi:integrase
VREWETVGVGAELVTVKDAVESFLKDANARNVSLGSIKNLRIVLEDLKRFADAKGLKAIGQFTMQDVLAFREGWTFQPVTALKKFERLRSFFRFVQSCGWIKVNPCEQVKPPRVDQTPTLPFTDEEYQQILAACDQLPDNYRRLGGPNAKRMKALVLLLRYSGLRIGDAVMLERVRIKNGRLFLYTQKTGTPVHLPLPAFVVEALEACPNKNPEYFFWTGDSTLHTVTNKWRQRFSKLLDLAKIKDGHFHRFRDSFAVDLLCKGVPIDQVSILLGHSSVRITEKHYAPWVKARQDRLEELVRHAWSA